MVRAKFRVSEIKRTMFTEKEGQVIVLNPVIDGSPENKEFYQYTPGGRIELGTVNAEAGNYFELGKEYYIDFTKADSKEVGT